MNAWPQTQELPGNLEAEAGLLGTMLADASGYPRVSDRLKADYFFLEAHQIIFAAIAELAADGKSITPITVKPKLDADMKVGDTPIAAYLLNLHREAASIISAVDYAEMIRDAWAKRKLLSIAGLAADLVAQSKAGGADRCIDTLSAELGELRVAVDAEATPMDMLGSSEAFVRRLQGQLSDHEVGIDFPFPGMNRIHKQGLRPRRLYGLIGASSEGKTSFILPLMRHAAEQGHPCAMLSFDQDRDECVQQMVVQSLRIPGELIDEHKLTGQQAALCAEEARRIDNLPMSFIECYDGRKSAMDQVIAQFCAHWGKRTIKPPLIIIDHIGSMKVSDERADAGTKAQEKTDFLKKAAKRHGCSILVLIQRNSKGVQNIDRYLPRPTKADIEGGEAARRDYDTVFGLFRPEFWRDEALLRYGDNQTEQQRKIEDLYGDCGGRLEIGLVKARKASARERAYLLFEGIYTRVSEPTPVEPEMPF